MLGTAGSRSAWQRAFPEVEDLPVITLDLTGCGERSEAEPTKAVPLLSRPWGPRLSPQLPYPTLLTGCLTQWWASHDPSLDTFMFELPGTFQKELLSF